MADQNHTTAASVYSTPGEYIQDLLALVRVWLNRYTLLYTHWSTSGKQRERDAHEWGAKRADLLVAFSANDRLQEIQIASRVSLDQFLPGQTINKTYPQPGYSRNGVYNVNGITAWLP